MQVRIHNPRACDATPVRNSTDTYELRFHKTRNAKLPFAVGPAIEIRSAQGDLLSVAEIQINGKGVPTLVTKILTEEIVPEADRVAKKVEAKSDERSAKST